MAAEDIKTALQQLRALRIEEKDLWKRIEETESALEELGRYGVCQDVVSLGKRGKRSLGRLQIEGLPDGMIQEEKRRLREYTEALTDCRHEIRMQIIAAERAIEKCQDSFVRTLLRLRFVDGLSWEDVSRKAGDYNSAGNCKMIISRYMKKL